MGRKAKGIAKAKAKAMAMAMAMAKREEEEPDMILTSYCMMEADPAFHDPHLLDAIRKKNSAAMASILDPRREHPGSNSLDTADVVWYITNSCNHITGNLNLLTDLTPVADRWVSAMTGQPMQVCARGSVNHNGIILHDVWYVPESKVNVVSISQLTAQDLEVHMDGFTCSIRRTDGSTVGKGHRGASVYELDNLCIDSEAAWYIVSNAHEHMTGNLKLLKDFTPTRPSRFIRTHTGTTLQVCGKGSVKTSQFSIPNVSYVAGLNENVVSVSQLTDSGFTVTFDLDGCTITRQCDRASVGKASFGGSQPLRLSFLRLP